MKKNNKFSGIQRTEGYVGRIADKVIGKKEKPVQPLSDWDKIRAEYQESKKKWADEEKARQEAHEMAIQKIINDRINRETIEHLLQREKERQAKEDGEIPFMTY